MEHDFAKYIVIKIDDAKEYLSPEEQTKLGDILYKIRIGRAWAGKEEKRHVVCSNTMPMYQQVWDLIETWVDNKNG